MWTSKTLRDRLASLRTNSTWTHLKTKPPICHRTKVKKMDELPELTFEQVLSYLNLEDRLRLRAVSRSCRQKITNDSRVKSLCYSSRSRHFIPGKNRWISGTFAQNFISSNQFTPFFNTFSQTILSPTSSIRVSVTSTCAKKTKRHSLASWTHSAN